MTFDWAHVVWVRETVKWTAWVVGGLWVWRASEAVWHMGEVVDLTAVEWGVGPAQAPRVAVIVPAKDEGPNLRATLNALAMQEYPWLHVVVVDDRSSDDTGAIADEFAAQRPELFTALHVTDLPEGWLGKTWALEEGVERVRDADWMLFTDADVLLSPSILWRAVGYAELSEADHLVVFPTLIVKKWTEGAMLGFFQVISLWASRPWRVSDPRARRDIAGVGAFNLVRRTAFEEIGGWRPQSMVVIEDMTLGRRMKSSGMMSRVAFAPGLVLVHWAAGLRGIVRVLTKNLFALVNFNPVLMLLTCAGLALSCLAPFAGLFWVGTLVPCLLTLLAVAQCYRQMKAMTGLSPRYGWGFPLGAMAMIAAMLRSMTVVLVQRGVTWRGTFYGLGELRLHNDPWRWERETAELRERERLMRTTKLRAWVDRVGARVRAGSRRKR